MSHTGEIFCVSFSGENIVPSSISPSGDAEHWPSRYVAYLQIEDYAVDGPLYYVLIQILAGADEVTEEKREKVRAYARWVVHDEHPQLLWRGLGDIPVIFLDEW